MITPDPANRAPKTWQEIVKRLATIGNKQLELRGEALLASEELTGLVGKPPLSWGEDWLDYWTDHYVDFSDTDTWENEATTTIQGMLKLTKVEKSELGVIRW